MLFGHHFAAIAGAGPLIGPVLAAQFGYLPGFLWILIGVCLAGAVQDFTILVFSMRRQGQSLAKLAFLEAGPVAGSAATIGILFVLVIALAGLGKVVTKALGGEIVKYAAGTQFIAPEDSPIISNLYGTPVTYRVPVGTRIIYPAGNEEVVSSHLTLESRALESDVPVDIEVAVAGKLSGAKLVVPEQNETLRKISGSAWGTFTIALTIPIALFVGWYIYRFRKGRVLEASIIGGLLTLGAVYLGGVLDGGASGSTGSWLAGFLSSYRETFNLSERQVGISMAVYGFIASILPVWLLLCSAGLSFQFPEDRHGDSAGGGNHPGRIRNCTPRRSTSRLFMAVPRLMGRCFRLSSSSSCAGRSRDFMRWWPPAQHLR